MRPSPDSYPPYFNTYIKLVEETDVITALLNHGDEAESFFLKINESETLYRYAEGKWTIKEILQHVNDTERIFCYRALAFARREQSILPGFSENQYAANSHANDLSWSSLLNDFKIARKNSISLFSSFNNDDLNFIGKVSDYSISVRALGFAIAGHCIHHMNIVKERYLSIA